MDFSVDEEKEPIRYTYAEAIHTVIPTLRNRTIQDSLGKTTAVEVQVALHDQGIAGYLGQQLSSGLPLPVLIQTCIVIGILSERQVQGRRYLNTKAITDELIEFYLEEGKEKHGALE